MNSKIYEKGGVGTGPTGHKSSTLGRVRIFGSN